MKSQVNISFCDILQLYENRESKIIFVISAPSSSFVLFCCFFLRALLCQKQSSQYYTRNDHIDSISLLFEKNRYLEILSSITNTDEKGIIVAILRKAQLCHAVCICIYVCKMQKNKNYMIQFEDVSFLCDLILYFSLFYIPISSLIIECLPISLKRFMQITNKARIRTCALICGNKLDIIISDIRCLCLWTAITRLSDVQLKASFSGGGILIKVERCFV